MRITDLEGKTVESVETRTWEAVITFTDGTVFHACHGGGRGPYVEAPSDSTPEDN